MKIDTLPIGLYEENTYVLHKNGHVLFIDPGRFYKEIMKFVGKDEIVDGIVLTHGHEDHTGAVDDLADVYNCKVFMNELDFILTDASKGVKKRGYEAPIYHEIVSLKEGSINIGEFDLLIHHTPGHTMGSVLIECNQCLFTGDTLFAGSIGRTDLFGGDESMMIKSLEKIKLLSDDLVVYPGHGPKTTIAHEKRYNQYLLMNFNGF